MPPRPHWFLVALAMVSVAWGGNEFTPLLVMYRQESGFTPTEVDLLLAAYVLGILPALLVGGPLSDRLGRRPLMLPAPVIAALGSGVLAVGATSVPVLFAGRVASGVALGLAMAVGTSWIKELSARPFDPAADAGSGARRASVSMTVGFMVGALSAACLAQWGPLPTALPYVVHVIVSVPCLMAVWSAPETHAGRRDAPGSLLGDLRVPSAGRGRFWRVVAPSAPWIFTYLGVAYAIVPGLMLDRVDHAIAFSGLLTVVTLACGVLVQPWARRLDRPGSVRAVSAGLLIGTIGLGCAVVATATLAVAAALLVAVALGLAYGTALVSGLQEVQRIATPEDLAGLTAVYYGLAYLGFFVPVAAAAAHRWFSYPVMTGALAVAAAGCCAVVATAGRRRWASVVGAPA